MEKETTPGQTLERLGFKLKWINGTFHIELNDKCIVAPNPDHELGTKLYNVLKEKYNIDEPHLKTYDYEKI